MQSLTLPHKHLHQNQTQVYAPPPTMAAQRPLQDVRHWMVFLLDTPDYLWERFF